MLDPTAVGIFAAGGIMLVETPKHDYAWSHDGYLRSEPSVKDLEIRIHKEDYMGPVVHRVIVRDVHINDARGVAEKVLVDFRKTLNLEVSLG